MKRDFVNGFIAGAAFIVGILVCVALVLFGH